MKTDELREKYLDFFVSKGHSLQPSDVLVPTWDKTVLFTPAGMNQFKDHFLGKVELEYKSATTCQKCLRTGDIENVGRTAFHHTFFEMLGNFSFGDYFKRDAIHWSWEFLTDKKWLGIDKEKLTITVFLDDDEAFNIWNNEIGVPASRISRMDEYENFWPAGAPTDGPDGVCGPCSEIYYVLEDGSDVEIWNLVFTQFNRSGSPPDNLNPLPNKNIDTGMGLERCASVLQNVTTNYHIDTLKPIVLAAGDICSQNYDPDSDNGRRLRRITDHVRASTFSIHENVYPGNDKANYIIKRLLRRAVLDGHQMGMREPFLHKLVPAIVDSVKRPYPELAQTAVRVAEGIKLEEERFLDTLDSGLNRIELMFDEMKSHNEETIPGEKAFDMYQTYGVPPELLEQIGEERGCGFDHDGYAKAKVKHAEVSNTFGKAVMDANSPLAQIQMRDGATKFLGYSETSCEAKLVGIVQRTTGENKESSDTEIESLVPSDEPYDPTSPHILVLNQTPFYGESGGQVGDEGQIEGPNGTFKVVDTQKIGELFLHFGYVESGTISTGEQVQAQVDQQRRTGISRAHSATHILHFALQKNLGEHAQQRGSKVEDDILRFDFSNQTAVSDELMLEIESESNRRVESAAGIDAQILPLADAREAGAMMLFGEKYPDPVRMVSMGEFSKELCGGIHLTNTEQVGVLEIVSEEPVSAGTRRIIAYTGEKAKSRRVAIQECVAKCCQLLGCSNVDLVAYIENLFNQVKSLKKGVSSGNKPILEELKLSSPSEELDYMGTRSLLRQCARGLNAPLLEVAVRVESMLAEKSDLLKQLETQASAGDISADALIESASEVNGVSVITCSIPGGNPNLLRKTIDQIRKKKSPVAIFLGAPIGDDKVVLVAGISNELVERGLSAGNWVKEIAPLVGGGGGGKPDMAQAGGKKPEKLDSALEQAVVKFSEFLAS